MKGYHTEMQASVSSYNNVAYVPDYKIYVEIFKLMGSSLTERILKFDNYCMTLDAKLRWKGQVKKKREELGLRYKKMYWLIGRNSSLSLHNELLLLHKQIHPFGHTVSNCGVAPNKVI